MSAVLLATAASVFAGFLISFPYLFYFVFAVAVSTLFGLGSGIAAFIFATLLSNFFLIPPRYAFKLDSSVVLTSAVYALTVILIVFLTRVVSRRGFDQKLKLLGSRLTSTSVEENQDKQMLGRVDGIIDGEIFGWSLDPVRESIAPKITIFVNNRSVGEVNAVHYRPDVGSHCFYFDVTRFLPETLPARVDARFSNGRIVANSPVQVTNLQRSRSSPAAETVLFMHIAKTAGTAFREAILENYRQFEVAYLYPEPPGFLDNNLLLLPLEQRAAFRFVVGHFQYGVHHVLPQESTYVTIVRDPVSRVVSEFRYLWEKQPAGSDPVYKTPSDLIQILERRESVNLDNHLVRCFSGVSELAAPPGHIDRQIYDLAVKNLESAFRFVGHQERSDEAYATLRDMFNWKPRSLEIVNKSKGPADIDYESVRSAIVQFNEWDCRLYTEICRLFPIPVKK